MTAEILTAFKSKSKSWSELMCTKLSQIGIREHYGIEKSFLRQLLNNQFQIPELYHDCLQHYRLSCVTSTEFFSRISDGTLVQQVGDTKIYFAVQYYMCSPYHIRKAKRVLLSFRMAKADIGLEPVVLVKIGE